MVSNVSKDQKKKWEKEVKREYIVQTEDRQKEEYKSRGQVSINYGRKTEKHIRHGKRKMYPATGEEGHRGAIGLKRAKRSRPFEPSFECFKTPRWS